MEKIEEIFTDQIDDPAVAMRGELDRDALFELADNIKQNGLINPITVRPKHIMQNAGDCIEWNGKQECEIKSHWRYEIVAGHRRLSACKIAGKIKIACVVRELTDEQAFAVMTAENLERTDVPLLDECRHYKTALERFGKSVKEIAKVAKRSEGYIQARLAIADMPEYMQQYLQEKKISLGVCLALMEITDTGVLQMWTEMAVRDGVSIAQAEYWVHGWRVSQLPGGTRAETPPGDFKPDVVAPLLFECAVDGKRYAPEDMRTVMIFKNNMDIFYAVVQELRETSDTPPSQGEGE